MRAPRIRTTYAQMPWEAPAPPGPVSVPVPVWTERALCAQTDPEAFFPEKGGATHAAKRVCMACEVRTECLEYALANQEAFGVWGGTSERERRRLIRARRAEQNTEVA